MEKKTDIKELPRLHKLLQGASTKSVEGGIKVRKICLPPISPPCLSKDLNEGQPPPGHCLPTIGKKVSPRVKKESPSHADMLLSSPLW